MQWTDLLTTLLKIADDEAFKNLLLRYICILFLTLKMTTTPQSAESQWVSFCVGYSTYYPVSKSWQNKLHYPHIGVRLRTK